MDPYKLSRKHSIEELTKMLEAENADPKNKGQQGSILLLNKRGRTRTAAIAWAITIKQSDNNGRPIEAATFSNYKSR